MTLDALLKLWYDHDPAYFDEMMLYSSESLADMAWTRAMSCLDDGLPFSDAFHEALTDEQADALVALLAPSYE